MKIDINGVSITLTQQQLNEISRQTSNKLTVNNINYESAKKLLEDYNVNPNPKGFYNDKLLEIITIIKAVNFIDNDYKEWIPYFNTNSFKYYPWFEKKGSVWAFGYVDDQTYGSFCSVGFCFKKENSAEIIANRFINDYNEILG